MNVNKYNKNIPFIILCLEQQFVFQRKVRLHICQFVNVSNDQLLLVHNSLCSSLEYFFVYLFYLFIFSLSPFLKKYIILKYKYIY